MRKLAIKIIKNHYGCISASIDEKEVEVYLISKLSKEKLQNNVEKVKEDFIFTDDFKFVDNLPNDLVEKVEVIPDETILKFPGIWIYNTSTKNLNISEELFSKLES